MNDDVDTSAWDPDSMPPAEPDELVLLANESMRARRRPAAILVLWAWQSALAFLVAWPVASAVDAWYGKHPRGDAVLWQPGALALDEIVHKAASAERSAMALLGLVLVLAAFTDLLPIASLFASLGYVTRERRAPPLRAAVARGAAAFGTFVRLMAMAAVAEGMLIAAALVAMMAISMGGADSLGEARADQVGWLVGALVLCVAALVGVLHDLARAAAVRFRVRVFRAWKLGINALARGPLTLLWSWAWRGLAAWAPVAVGALVAARVGGRGGVALAALFAVHQIALVTRVALRASWFAAALRAVDHAHRVVRARA